MGAWSFACLWRFARRTKKKERLLVVYSLIYNMWKSSGTEIESIIFAS